MGTRHEVSLVAGLGLMLLVVGLAADRVAMVMALAATVYLAWHLINVIQLRRWLARSSASTPRAYGIWGDVHRALRHRRELRRTRGRAFVRGVAVLRDAARTLPDALVIMDAEDGIRWFNSAAGRLLGLHWPGDRRRDLSRLVPHPVLKEYLADAGRERPLEIPSPVNGAWMLSIKVSAIGNAGQRLLVGRDITATYRLEQARRDFVADVSHELRTPITVFRGYLEPLQEVAKEAPKWAAPLERMDQQAARMESFVADLLTLSGLEMEDRPRLRESVPVASLLAEIRDEALALSGASGHVIRLAADPELHLFGDRAALRSAFANLVVNAVDHTPPGSRIEVVWERDSNGACLRVSDNGDGIAAYHQPRLTERFYRVDKGRSSEHRGTGLGLAIVKQVLDNHDAELGISSDPGNGSSFSCHFLDAAIRKSKEEA